MAMATLIGTFLQVLFCDTPNEPTFPPLFRAYAYLWRDAKGLLLKTDKFDLSVM
jgi:hypothetical protein